MSIAGAKLHQCKIHIMETRTGPHPHWRQTLELPGELREPLTDLAHRNERSVAAEVRHALRQHVKAAQTGGDDVWTLRLRPPRSARTPPHG